MAVGLLVSTALMAALVVAVLYFGARVRGWYHYTPQTARPDGGWSPGVEADAEAGGTLSRPTTWVVAFFAVTAVAVGGIFVLATGSGPAASGTILLGAVGVIVLGYLLGGIYLMARQRGHSNAMALAESLSASGAVFLLLITVQLVALG